MNIELDENLPSVLASMLSDLGHDVDTVVDEGLAAENDDTIVTPQCVVVILQTARASGAVLR